MQLLIDESFVEKVIPAVDSVRLLDRIVEEMDLSELERAYDVRGWKPATESSIMFKILLYANMESIYSSRRIRTACQRDINFIWLLNGVPAPSYHEIARFRSQRLPLCAEELFFQLAEKLAEYGEIKFEHLFVDGTKIEANDNKYSFVRISPRVPATKAKRPIAILRASQQRAISNRRIMSAVKQRNSKVIWRSARSRQS